MNTSVAEQTMGGGAADINFIVPSNQENLGTIAVFCSALLLSCGGFCAQVIQAWSKSRCVEIDCFPCVRCVRSVDPSPV